MDTKTTIDLTSCQEYFKKKLIVIIWMVAGVFIGLEAADTNPNHLWTWIGVFGAIATFIYACIDLFGDELKEPRFTRIWGWLAFIWLIGFGSGYIYGWLGAGLILVIAYIAPINSNKG